MKKGFDVITRISVEELESKISDKKFFEEVRKYLEQIISFAVFGGYLLYLVEHQIDPKIKELSKSKSTEGLGSRWMEEYEKDRGESMLTQIDPIIGLFIEKGKQSRLNQLAVFYPKIMEVTYKVMLEIDTFINWVSMQGYVFGLLETSLNTAVKS